MVIENKYIADYPKDKISMDLAKVAYTNYKSVSTSDRADETPISFVYLLRGALSGKVMAKIGSADNSALLATVVKPNNDTVLIQDAQMLGAKSVVINYFKRAFSIGGSKRVQADIVRGTIPEIVGAVNCSLYNTVYILTYIFVNDKLLEDKSLWGDQKNYIVADIEDLKNNYTLSDFSQIFADQFIGTGEEINL